jgi:hypothetical protein
MHRTSVTPFDNPADSVDRESAYRARATPHAYGSGDARVANDGNRFRPFGRSLHIVLGLCVSNVVNTDIVRVSSVVL